MPFYRRHANPAYREAVLATNPVSYWRLGEASGTVARDEMGANNGTYVNAPTLGVAGLLAGDPDTAVTFVAASSQRITAGSTGFPTGASARTIAFWMNVAAGVTSPGLFAYGTNSGTGLTDVFLNASGYLNIWSGSSGAQLTGNIRDGTIKFVAITYDGAKWLSRVNGVEGSPVPQALNTAAGTTAYMANDSAAGYLSGTLAKPAIWGRAITPAEIAELYRIGMGR